MVIKQQNTDSSRFFVMAFNTYIMSWAQYNGLIVTGELKQVVTKFLPSEENTYLHK